MLNNLKIVVAKVLSFTKGMLSEPDGTPSSTRVLLIFFSGFSAWTINRIVTRLLTLNDPNLLVIFFNNIPYTISALIALIAAPYTINQGAGAVRQLTSLLSKRNAVDDPNSKEKL